MTDKAENIITTELAKENVTEAVIAKLKKDYLPLKINGINDTEGYKKVHDARIVCRDTRTLAEKICKRGREDAIKEQKAWIAKEKEVVAQVSEVEQYLKKQEDAIDDAKEAIKIRAERLLKLPGRKEQIESNGIATYFAIEMSDDILMGLDDNAFTQMVFEAQSKKLAKQQKDIDDAKTLARLNRLTERTNILYGVSAVMKSNNGRKEFVKGDVHYSEDDIADMPQEQWDKVCAEFKSAVIPEPAKAGVSYRPSVTTKAEPAKEISDEEKLFDYASALENIPGPSLKTSAGKETFAKAADLLIQALTILRQ